MIATAATRWHALGTTVELLVSHPMALYAARRAVEQELEAIDLACSRFRPDAELVALNAAAGGGPRAVGPRLLEAVAVAVQSAALTDGAVDPTVGHAIVAAGYDRDFDLGLDDPSPFVPVAASGWRAVEVNAAASTVSLPAGTALDLGATAKGLAADRAAAAGAEAIGAQRGVLVSLGGDLAIAGIPPRAGWSVGIADDHRDDDPEVVVTIRAGGLATSGLTARRWTRGGESLHHVLDPDDGRPVAAVWRTASVADRSCARANARSTAALVWGAEAPGRLEAAGVAARLVAVDGAVVTTGGWPSHDHHEGEVA